MLYDYFCKNCSHELKDIVQSIKDPPKKVCPECGKHTLERVIYGAAGAFVNNSNCANQKPEAIKPKSRSEEPEPLRGKHATATRKDINNMTEKQKQKYIMKGDK